MGLVTYALQGKHIVNTVQKVEMLPSERLAAFDKLISDIQCMVDNVEDHSHYPPG